MDEGGVECCDQDREGGLEALPSVDSSRAALCALCRMIALQAGT
jgi:hypothetical protein